MKQNAQEGFKRSFDSLNGGDQWCRSWLAEHYAHNGVQEVHRQLDQERISGSRPQDADLLLAGLRRLDQTALRSAVEDAEHCRKNLLQAIEEREAAEQASQNARSAWESAATALRLTIENLRPKVNAAEDAKEKQLLPWFQTVRFYRHLGPEVFLDVPESLKTNRNKFEAEVKRFRELYDYAYCCGLDDQSPSWSVFEGDLQKLNEAQASVEDLLAKKQQAAQTCQAVLEIYWASISRLQQLLLNLKREQRVALFSLIHRELPNSNYREGVPIELRHFD